MKERDREGVVISGVMGILLLAWLGFFFHRSPRFPGSGFGAVFGIAAAVLMVVPLAYPIAKRIPSFGARIAKLVPRKTLMTLHVYAGILGPLLAIIHTGHKFDSWMGIALTAVMLIVVVSGYSVRYLLAFVSHDMTEKLVLLQTARGDLDHAWGMLDNSPADIRIWSKAPVLAAGLASLGLTSVQSGPAGEVTRIAESVADLEYSVRMDELLKIWFGRALYLHIALSIGLYVLLALHIAAAVQFGLRWL